MKIAFPVSEKSIDAEIHESFGTGRMCCQDGGFQANISAYPYFRQRKNCGQLNQWEIHTY